MGLELMGVFGHRAEAAVLMKGIVGAPVSDLARSEEMHTSCRAGGQRSGEVSKCVV